MEHKIKDIIMGCLFISGDEGVSPVELRRIVNMDADGVREVLKEIKKELKSENKYMQLVEWGGRFKLTTLPEHHKYYEILAVEKLRTPLRPNLMETLAVIAYNQPCTRRMVDDIRGTNNNINIDRLIDKGLVEEVGRDSSPGNPFLYEVTKKFYDLFGIKTLSDLPKPNDFAIEATDEEVFEFTKKLKEEEIQNQILEDQKEKDEMQKMLADSENEILKEEELNNIKTDEEDRPEFSIDENNNIYKYEDDDDEYEDEEDEYEEDEYEDDEDDELNQEEYEDENEQTNNFVPELDKSHEDIDQIEITSKEVLVSENNEISAEEVFQEGPEKEEVYLEYESQTIEVISQDNKSIQSKIVREEFTTQSISETIKKTDTRILEELLEDEDDEDVDDIFADLEDED